MQFEKALIENISCKKIIADTYLIESGLRSNLRASFKQSGYVKLPGFLKTDAFSAVTAEVTRLHSTRVRKDFVMPDYNTERKMSVLSGKEVVRQSETIANLYACQQLREWIADFTGQDIHTVQHDEEFLVVNFLDGKRDTHGWHLDDPRYALIIVVESPAEQIGGRLEYVPNWKRLAREAGFDAERNIEHGVEVCRTNGWLRADTLHAGDCYLLDAGEVLHRVSPMSAEGSRKALNLAFDDRRYREYGETATRLYA